MKNSTLAGIRERGGSTMTYSKILCVLLAIIAITIGTADNGFARLTEPDVVYLGAVTGGIAGSVITVKLDADGSILKTTTVKNNLNYLLRIPMDSVELRVAGTARAGDKASLYLGEKRLHTIVIPERGSVVTLSLAAAPTILQDWQRLHPGDDGSGDQNRNGITDLQDFLNGDDPTFVWNLLTLSTLADKAITTDPTLNVAGTVTDNGTGIGVKSVTVSGQATTITNGAFSIAIPLVQGANGITTIATDNSDHKTIDTRTISLDRSAPTIVINQPADNSVTARQFVAVTGSVDPPTSTVTAKVNNGSPANATMSGANFSVTVNLSSGLNTIDITAKDLAENSGNAKLTITSDAVSPTVAVSTPAQDISTTLSSIIVKGAVSDIATRVTISIVADDQTYTPTVAVDGSFSQTISMDTEKTYAVIVTATDEAGHSTMVKRNIIKTTVELQDILTAFKYATGQLDVSVAEKLLFDCAPLGADGKPKPDGIVDFGDVVMMLRKIVGLVHW